MGRADPLAAAGLAREAPRASAIPSLVVRWIYVLDVGRALDSPAAPNELFGLGGPGDVSGYLSADVRGHGASGRPPVAMATLAGRTGGMGPVSTGSVGI